MTNPLDIPPGAWDRRDGIALIDPEVGLALWREARHRRDTSALAARLVKQSDKVIRAILGRDCTSLVTTDGVGLALIAQKGTRKSLDRDALCKALGVADLAPFEIEKPTYSLELAASIGGTP